MGIGHLGAGLAVKRLAPQVSLGVLLLSAELIDILWIVFTLVGIEKMGTSPWSHSLFMAVVWSLAAAVVAIYFYRDRRAAALIGLVVFSHWVLDFISHPMGALGMGSQPDLPLFLTGSAQVGLGLYNSIPGVVAGELGMILLGLAFYIPTRFHGFLLGIPGQVRRQRSQEQQERQG
jgi:hypothetical protein